MRIRIQRLIVTVATTDTNPASVARSVEVALSALTAERDRIYLTEAEPVGNDPIDHEIPDVPFAQPDNDAEMRAADAWVNDILYPLMGGR